MFPSRPCPFDYISSEFFRYLYRSSIHLFCTFLLFSLLTLLVFSQFNMTMRRAFASSSAATAGPQEIDLEADVAFQTDFDTGDMAREGMEQVCATMQEIHGYLKSMEEISSLKPVFLVVKALFFSFLTGGPASAVTRRDDLNGGGESVSENSGASDHRSSRRNYVSSQN